MKNNKEIEQAIEKVRGDDPNWELQDRIMDALQSDPILRSHILMEERSAEKLIDLGIALERLSGSYLDEVRDNRINN